MLLEIKNVYKSFGIKEVLKGISITAKSGTALGILGRNGAGKTTTIRILMNVFPMDKGEIYIDGKPISYDKISFGYLPEERGLYPKKKIIDQLTYFAELKGVERKKAVKSIDYWLERLGMSEYRNKRLDTLSKGNQQKIQMITALAHDPQIIIFDEPFSGLDPVNSLLLKDVIQEQIKNNKIVLFSSHQMSYIEEFCNNIAIMNGGEIVLSGNLDHIKRNYSRDTLSIRSLQVKNILRDYPDNCVQINDEYIEFSLSSPEDKMKIINMISTKYDIDEIKVKEPSLNDIFIEYTEKQI